MSLTGTLEAYKSTYPWNLFTNIEEIKGPEYTLTYIVHKTTF